MNTATALYLECPSAMTEVSSGGLEVIDRHAEEWRALCERSTRDEPFYRPEWIRAYVTAFAPTARVVVFAVRRMGQLIALLPLLKELGTLGGLPARKLRSPGNAHTCRFELVCEPDAVDEVIPQLWRALLAARGWDVLELENVVDGGVLARLAEHAHSLGYPIHRIPGLTPPYLDLTPGGRSFDTLLERVDGKFRANVRRRMRKLEGRGPVSLVHENAAHTMLERFYALERRGWKGAEGSAIGCDDATRRFYDEVGRAAERYGYLSLYALEHAGGSVAMFYGLNHRDRFYLLKTAYDESLREFSPGQLLTYCVLRELVENGCREFDFLGGLMDWKQDWVPELRRLADVFVFRGATGQALHGLRFRLRPAVAKAVRRLRAG